MTKKQERNIIASVGTVLFMGFVILLLWLLQLSVTEQPKKDYIEVEYLEEEMQKEEEVPQPKPVVKSGAKEGAASPAKEEPSNQPTQTTAEQMESKVEDLVAIRQQQIADSIAQANEQATKKAQDLIGGFNFSEVDESGVSDKKTDNGGQGRGKKDDGQANKNWSLEGRGLVGVLPKPANTFKQAGTVVVQITVDASGKVIEAIVIGGNIGDKATMDLALEAAKKAKFTSAKQIKQVGTITYIFKDN